MRCSGERKHLGERKNGIKFEHDETEEEGMGREHSNAHHKHTQNQRNDVSHKFTGSMFQSMQVFFIFCFQLDFFPFKFLPLKNCCVSFSATHGQTEEFFSAEWS